MSALERLRRALWARCLFLGLCLRVGLGASPSSPASRALRDRIRELGSDRCVCAEINTRHCPVHGQGEPDRGVSPEFREWLATGSAGSVQRERYEEAMRAWNRGASEAEVAEIMGLKPPPTA